jgi:cell division inhibitor SepF
MKVRLGLEDEWDDEEYYEDDEYVDDSDELDDEPRSRKASFDSPFSSGAGAGAVKRLDRGPDMDRARSHEPQLRSVPTGPVSGAGAPPQVKMHIVEPKSFAEAQSIADKFKQGTPVILNMAMTKPDLAKRMLDFCSGLTYGLDGGLQKVSDRVFMLTPHNVQVSDSERRRLQSTGLFPSE